MRTQTAKQLSLPELLARLGYQPTRVSGNKLWYLSPLHRERTASFCVAPGTRVAWIFTDYGSGLRGNILDFAIHFKQCSLASALNWLTQIMGDDQSSGIEVDRYSVSAASSIEIRACRPLYHPALLSYLTERGITTALARNYLREVHYRNGGQPRFALGWQTDAGGWCLRAAYFKACVRPAGITTVGGAAERLAVFEGMFDFLAALSHYRKTAPQGQVIILNSVAHLHHAVEMIKAGQYQSVRLYLDNDQAGRQAAQQLLALKKTIDCSVLYSPAKDFAEWYEAGRKGISLLSPVKVLKTDFCLD